SDDPGYGTRLADVIDTVEHRIAPHLRRLFVGRTRVADFGAGDGRFLHVLWNQDRIHTGIGVDLHQPAMLEGWLLWAKQPLWRPIEYRADYAISTDTLEHLPPEKVQEALRNIAATAPHGFLRISNRQDRYGTERGLHLHETVEPPEWWLEQLLFAGFPPLHSWRVYPGHALEVWY